VRDPILAATAGAAIIVAAFAAPAQPAGRGRSNNLQDSNARQTACADVVGLLLVFM
jgi:hypothetical protein